jgi:hypothetical protein
MALHVQKQDVLLVAYQEAGEVVSASVEQAADFQEEVNDLTDVTSISGRPGF